MNSLQKGYLLALIGLTLIGIGIGSSFMLPQAYRSIELDKTEELIQLVGVFSLFLGLGFTHYSLFIFGYNRKIEVHNYANKIDHNS